MSISLLWCNILVGLYPCDVTCDVLPRGTKLNNSGLYLPLLKRWAVADPGGGGGPGGPAPPFGPRCRLFNIGPKFGPPLAPPPFLLVDLRWTRVADPAPPPPELVPILKTYAKCA